MVALSCGSDAETLGSLMTLASGRVDQLAQLGEVVVDALLGGELPRGRRRGPGRRGRCRAARPRPRRRGEGVDHRQQRPRGQRRGLVGVGVDDGVTSRSTWPVTVAVSGRPPRWRGPPGRSPGAPPPSTRRVPGERPGPPVRRPPATSRSPRIARRPRRPPPAQRTGRGEARAGWAFTSWRSSWRDAARCARRPRPRCGTASRWWWARRRRPAG